MINLKFNSMRLEGFQSLGKAEITFNNLGTCFIKGINKYDSKTKSNGAGKSSLLSSICWCLFGKTPAGVTNDVVNKFYKNGCFVELNVDVDNTNYIIRRSQKHKEYKTNLTILKNNEDISGRNKTDSDKIIKDIIKIDNEIFSQIIFLSQGFNNKFATYSPKERKELLESLYHINDRLEDFVNNLKTKEGKVTYNIKNNELSTTELRAKMDMQLKLADDTQQSMVNAQQQIRELINQKSNISQNDIDEINKKIKTLEIQKEAVNDKFNKRQQLLFTLKHAIDENNNKIKNLKIEVNRYSNNKVCPTCGTVLEDYSSNEHIKNHITELNDEITRLTNEIECKQKDYETQNIISNNMYTKLNSMSSSLKELKNNLNSLHAEYEQELQKDTKIASLRNNVFEFQNKIYELSDEVCSYAENINKNNDKLKDLNRELSLIQHCVRLSTTHFKSYLLNNVIIGLNTKLKELSSLLFENETIVIEGDNKLDIYLNEKTYEQLSGGERKKVDIAIIIAQRFLAQLMNSISSNILILDEIFDGCDEISFNIILDLICNEMQDVETTFIISHRDIKEIAMDHMITVTKDKNQISSIEIS